MNPATTTNHSLVGFYELSGDRERARRTKEGWVTDRYEEGGRADVLGTLFAACWREMLAGCAVPMTYRSGQRPVAIKSDRAAGNNIKQYASNPPSIPSPPSSIPFQTACLSLSTSSLSSALQYRAAKQSLPSHLPLPSSLCSFSIITRPRIPLMPA